MLQTLFYIPSELFGLPVFGFGLLLAVWAVASAAFLAWLIHRQGFNADTRSQLPVLALLGAAIAWALPMLCDVHGLPIRGYGMMMLLAVLAGMGLAVYRARRVGVDPEMIFTLAFWMILPGILGARAVYVCEYWFRDFWPAYGQPDFRPVNWHGLGALLFAVVNVAAGGLVVYGSFIGAMLGLGLFWRRYRMPLLATADLIAPSMLLGLALGRVGCLLNGCCYGVPCDLPWKVTFPWSSPVRQHEAEQGIAGVYGICFRDGQKGTVIDRVDPDSLAYRQGLRVGMEIKKINDVKVESAAQAAGIVLGIDKHPWLNFDAVDPAGNARSIELTVDRPLPRSLPVHPTQLYSTIDALILCFLLLAYDRFRRRDGELTALMLTIYPITRFLIEKLRDDEAAKLGTGLHISQIISLGLLPVAVCLWIYILRRPAKLAFGGG